jgi:hypothetical protein
MGEWFAVHWQSVTAIILTVTSGFFSFVFLVLFRILKHGQKLERLEANLDKPSLDDVKRLENRVAKLEEKLEAMRNDKNSAAWSDRTAILLNDLIERIRHLSDQVTSASAPHHITHHPEQPDPQPKRPIREISPSDQRKSQTRTKRVRKKDQPRSSAI